MSVPHPQMCTQLPTAHTLVARDGPPVLGEHGKLFVSASLTCPGGKRGYPDSQPEEETAQIDVPACSSLIYSFGFHFFETRFYLFIF